VILNAEYLFDAPVAQVWDLLMDPQIIASCLPGCQKFEPLGEDRYRIAMTAGVAAIAGSFAGTVAIADKNPHTSYRLIVESRGTLGFANGEARIALRSSGNGVAVEVSGTVNVGGLVAQVGQRLLGGTARTMMDAFFKCLQSRVRNGQSSTELL
jgi:carbon monoxide dehydrogenase subunit G